MVNDDHCPLCQQVISPSTALRIQSFEEAISSTLQSDAEASLKVYKDALLGLPITPHQNHIVTSLGAACLDEDVWLSKVLEMWRDIEEFVEIAKKGEENSGNGWQKSKELEALEKHLSDVELEITRLEKDVEKSNISKLKQEVLELESKKWVSENKTLFLEEWDRLETLCFYDLKIRAVNTTMVSKKAKEVSEELITDAYINRFNEELALLGAGHLGVEVCRSSVKKAKVMHRIRLKGISGSNGFKGVMVLSDGEKRIVTLAAFLADVRGRKGTNPFVFDDPISSLDQEYEKAVAKRLADLSDERQVIVFTHRLSLLGALNLAATPKCLYIRKESWGSGEHSETPLFSKAPIKAIRKVKDHDIARAKKVIEDQGRDVYNQLARGICSDIRILIERVVEREMLNDIVLRHRGGVHTDNKIHLLAKIDEKDCNLIEKMMSVFSFHVHSQSDEVPIEVPEPDEIEARINELLTWHDQFKEKIKV